MPIRQGRGKGSAGMKNEDLTAFKLTCVAMIESGHGDEVRAFGKELLAEAIRRKLPLSPDLQRLRKAMAMNKILEAFSDELPPLR